MEIETPRVGEKKKLMLPRRSILQRPKIVEGFYIGQNPLQTPNWKKLTLPEGHSFLVLDENQEQTIYCQRTQQLDLTYWDDLDNCPYPMGIEVWPVEGLKLNPLELEYVQSKITKLK